MGNQNPKAWSQVRSLLLPAVAETQSQLRARKPVDLYIDFCDDRLLFEIDGERVPALNRTELEQGYWKDLFKPRLVALLKSRQY